VSLLAAGGFALWAVGPHWLRYLLPTLPLLALAAAAGLARLPRWALPFGAAVWLAGLPANLQPSLSQASEQAAVALGQESPEDYLQRELPPWSALRWLNEETGPEARVALLYSWYAWHLQRPWILGSVEDHVPTRHLLALHGDQALEQLRAAGVSHLLVARIHFLRKSYPFLDEASFEARFRQPEEQLQRLLVQEAVLVFEQGRHSVWKL